MKKLYWSLAVFATLFLTVAAIWMGSLNQDEGWYLYAANLVAEGKVLYRDFFYTQAPLMPIVYSAFTSLWTAFGLLGARIFTAALALLALAFFAGTAARLAPTGKKGFSALLVIFLIGVNLYHAYYTAIPKTYALASLFLALGFFLLAGSAAHRARSGRAHASDLFFAGLALALAAGTRISLAAVTVVVAAKFLFGGREGRRSFLIFSLGAFVAVVIVYAPYLVTAPVQFFAAMSYHGARGGYDVTWFIGSLSRLVRWYLPVFIVLGLGMGIKVEKRAGGVGVGGQGNNLLLFSFLAVFALQMLAPFPYEDYQVPIMGLLAVYAAVTFATNLDLPLSTSATSFPLLLILGLSFASSFGSPLLEQWTTNGQDRFWSVRKEQTELGQLRAVARRINELDPGGTELLTEDLYLAIETRRTVPHKLEMGPFSFWGDRLPYRGAGSVVLDDRGMRELLASAPCKVAALSGYSFAITVPACTETPMERQLEYWSVLKRNYKVAFSEYSFGQNATTLLVLERK